MKGISLPKVVRAVHMLLDLVCLRGEVVDVLITHRAKYFDVLAQDVHPVVGSCIGLGRVDHLFAHTEGYKYTTPVGTLYSKLPQQLLGIPEGTLQGVHGDHRGWAQSGDITPSVLGSQCGEKITNGYTSRAVLGAHMWPKWLHIPCLLGGRQFED